MSAALDQTLPVSAEMSAAEEKTFRESWDRCLRMSAKRTSGKIVRYYNVCGVCGGILGLRSCFVGCLRAID